MESKRIGEHAQALQEYMMPPEYRKRIEELAEKAKRRQSPGYIGRGWAIDKAIIAIHKENAALRASLVSVTKERDELKEAAKWISVEERLPEIAPDEMKGWVLVWNGHWRGVGKYDPSDYGMTEETWYDETRDWIIPLPTHWQPLPAPPKEADRGPDNG